MVRRTLSGLEGVKRRFTRTGTVDGVGIIDDYGHHPVEIRAVLRTARARAARPRHRRRPAASLHAACSSLFEEFCTCFHDADTVLVAPVYAAGEPPIEGVDRDALVEGVRAPRPSRRAADRRAGRSGAADRASSRGRATSSSAWAPAASPSGPTRCPGRLAALEKGAGEA